MILARERLACAAGAEVGRERGSSYELSPVQSEILRSVSVEVKSCTSRISGLVDKVSTDDRLQLHSFLHVLHVFDVEMTSKLGEWASVLEVIQVRGLKDPETSFLL